MAVATPDLGSGISIGSQPASDPSKNGWWWIFKDNAGNVYLHKQSGSQIPGTNARGYALGTDADVKTAGWFGTKLHEALAVLGANGKQGAAATQFFDAGGFIQGQTAIQINPAGQSTGKPSTSEAVYSPIVPEGPFKGALNALSLTSLFGSSSLWAGVGMAILGAVLVMFGIVKLSGADPKQLAKRVIP